MVCILQIKPQSFLPSQMYYMIRLNTVQHVYYQYYGALQQVDILADERLNDIVGSVRYVTPEVLHIYLDFVIMFG